MPILFYVRIISTFVISAALAELPIRTIWAAIADTTFFNPSSTFWMVCMITNIAWLLTVTLAECSHSYFQHSQGGAKLVLLMNYKIKRMLREHFFFLTIYKHELHRKMY